MSSPVPASPASLGKVTRFLVLTIAAIGFLFDTYELLMFPVIGSDAVGELIKVNADGTSPGWLAELGFGGSADLKRGIAPTSAPVREWGGRMLWIAALAGGACGLLGGWMIDRLGRKTIMIASILAYSVSPVAAAFSSELWQLVLFRSTTFIGVCVEMVAAVTWLAELFDDKRTREMVIGWTLATASLGGILVTEAYNMIVEAAKNKHLPLIPFPDGHNPGNVAWRFTLLTGLIPGAIILFLMPFVPESGVWKRKKLEGSLKRPGFGELFSPALCRTTIATTILSACGYAAAFGAIQMTPLQIVAGLPDMAPTIAESGKAQKVVLAKEAKLKDTKDGTPEFAEAEAQLAEARKAKNETDQPLKARRGDIQKWQEIGGLVGRILLAVLLLFVSSKTLIRLFLIPGIILFPLTYFRPRSRRLRHLRHRHLLLRVADRGAVQLPERVSAQGLSDAPARHRRQLRHQLRRTHDRHHGRHAEHRLPVENVRGQVSRRSATPGGRGRGRHRRGCVFDRVFRHLLIASAA